MTNKPERKKRKKSLIGWTINDWALFRDDDIGSLIHTNIVFNKQHWINLLSEKPKIKVRITIEEI